VSHWSQASIFNRFQDVCIQIYLDHDLDLSGSRDVIVHVTIWFPRCHFLLVLYCNRAAICSQFRDNGPQTYRGHELDLSRSRDIIGHVTNRSAICHFLLVSHWNWISIFNCFRDICIKIYLGHDLDLLSLCLCVFLGVCHGHVSSVTWPFDSSYAISYRCSIVANVFISSHFRDNGPQIYLGHDLDLSRSVSVCVSVCLSRSCVIGHVTIWFPRLSRTCYWRVTEVKWLYWLFSTYQQRLTRSTMVYLATACSLHLKFVAQ